MFKNLPFCTNWFDPPIKNLNFYIIDRPQTEEQTNDSNDADIIDLCSPAVEFSMAFS